jgi:hypothetical protein
MRHPDYQDISRRFRQRSEWIDDQPLEFPADNVDLFYLPFTSGGARYLVGHNRYDCPEHHLTFPGEPARQSPPDYAVKENTAFRYPLVREHAAPSVRRRSSRAIVILHGLNERSFTKYIPWAYHLWNRLQVPVILFPLSFHINRVNPAWMFGQNQNFIERKQIEGNDDVHRFNAVMSDRLGSHPERFFWGAIQSYWDLVDLAREIRSGRHPHFEAGTHLDLFGFSAGGYVALALMLENSENLFALSRAVLFATCVAVRDASLSSPFIIDQAAETALMNLFVKHMNKLPNPRLEHWLNQHAEGNWFRGFCGLRPDRARLEARLREIAPRILGIINSADNVMPAGAMYNALQGIRRDTGVRMVEMELGMHENPFVSSMYTPGDRSLITESLNKERYGAAFEQFIGHVASHLSGT